LGADLKERKEGNPAANVIVWHGPGTKRIIEGRKLCC